MKNLKIVLVFALVVVLSRCSIDIQLKVYAVLGGHEIGDNPWRGEKAESVLFYKDAFRRHHTMTLLRPEHMQETAFY